MGIVRFFYLQTVGRLCSFDEPKTWTTMKKTIFASLFLLPLLMSAQPAPDFTLTDSNGNELELYADYLNQGKTVVLKFFFTYCPPCNSTAPQLVPFYEMWGNGMGDVEMISLSIVSNDTDQDVNDYKNMYGHLWPGVGSDGGSQDAVEPYIDDTWGNFLGTPTFAVIAPDGSVQFDPRGSGFGATLDSLNAAILATGARMAESNIQVQGNVSGLQQSTVGFAQIGVMNQGNALALTNNEGNFDFTEVLPIFESQTLTVQVADTARASVNVLDAIRIQKHILSIQPFTTPFERLSADVDRSGEINILDVIAILRYIATKPSVMDDQAPWLFIDADYPFADPDSPALEVFGGSPPEIEFTPAENPYLEIIGIRIGDVDGSANQ